MASEIRNLDAVSVSTSPQRGLSPALQADNPFARTSSALTARPHPASDGITEHAGSPPHGNHSRGGMSLGFPYQSSFPSSVQGRSLSLSPTHFGGRRRVATDPSLLFPGSMVETFTIPAVSFLDNEHPPQISETQRAMEAAVAAERKRAKEMEEQETDLSAEELRSILKKERRRTSGFVRTIAQLRSTAVHCQLEAEIHEEGRVNTLMRRLETMQKEKERVINDLEREEEMLTNTLQKKLAEVRNEKLKLQKMIEREQDSNAIMTSKLNGLQGNSDDSDKKVSEQKGNIQAPSETLTFVPTQATAVPATFAPTIVPALDSLVEGEEGDEEVL